MPLILAVNPGGSQSSTLARLARELKAYELVGADSYAIAVKAIDQQVPDLVLLPGADGKGSMELLNRLRAVPGGVPILKLPPPGAIDFAALAAQVTALLPQAKAPALSPPHLLAAAKVAIDWIRARRAAWAHTDAFDREPEPPEPAPYPVEHAPYPAPVPAAGPAPLMYDPTVPAWTPPPVGPSVLSRAADAARDSRELAMAWLPRVAALVVLAAVAAAGMYFWPDIRAGLSSTTDMLTTRSRDAPVETETAPPDPGPARSGRGRAGVPPPTAAEQRLPGWLAVFSPVELSISEGTAAIVLDDQGRAMLPPGPHKLRFRNRELGYDEVRTVQIRPTATTILNLIPQTTIGVTSTEPAEVLIDGTAVGQTPIVGRRLNLGTHTVVVRSSKGAREIIVEATTEPIQLDVDFARP